MSKRNSFEQRGSGYLVLESGAKDLVMWEVEVLSDGIIETGSVQGNEMHLAAAAKNGCATLLLTSEIKLIIKIDKFENGRAPFRTISTSRTTLH